MKRRCPFAIVAAITLILVLLTGACGQNPPVATTAPETTQGTTETTAATTVTTTESAPTAVTVTDQAGRAVTIEGPVERIVSGYYISSSACIALGLTDKLVGIEAKADTRPVYALAAPALLTLQSVGTAKEFNLEACLALEPDLVILPIRLRDSADTLAALGIPVILVSPESHDELVEMISLIGSAAGAEESARKLTDYYSAELTAVAALASQTAERPTVYMGGTGSYLTTAPRDMYQASLIAAAGGVNAADRIEGSSWTELSYEQLAALNPEVIVIPSEATYGKADVLGDTQLAKLAAVQEGRVYQMPRDFEAWDSPVPSCTLGMRWLLSVLHEDLYPLEDMRAEASRFYREFYGADIDVGLIGT